MVTYRYKWRVLKFLSILRFISLVVLVRDLPFKVCPLWWRLSRGNQMVMSEKYCKHIFHFKICHFGWWSNRGDQIVINGRYCKRLSIWRPVSLVIVKPWLPKSCKLEILKNLSNLRSIHLVMVKPWWPNGYKW